MRRLTAFPHPIFVFHRRALQAAGFAAIVIGLVLPAIPSADSSTLQVSEYTAAFAISRDNRVAYSVRRFLSTSHYHLQRDDVWLATLAGKKNRIVGGDKFPKDSLPFSYSIQSFSWAPDSHKLIAQMQTSQIADEHGTVQEGVLADLIDDSGKEAPVTGTGNSSIFGAYQAQWLGDNSTVAYLTEAVKPRALFEISTVRPSDGHGAALFHDHTFAAVAWDTPRNAAIAIERERSLSGPVRLVWLDLLRQTRRELAVVPAFDGNLTVSHSGERIAFFGSPGVLTTLTLAHPDKLVTVTIPYGRYEWSPDDRYILLKRGLEKNSGDLIWMDPATGQFSSTMHGLVFADFQISPDGNWLGLLNPGRHGFQIVPLPAPEI
jgi:hypothetical protein